MKEFHHIPALHQQISDAFPTKFWFLEHHPPVGYGSSIEHLIIHLTILQPKEKKRNIKQKIISNYHNLFVLNKTTV